MALLEYFDLGMKAGAQTLPALTIVFYAIFARIFKEMRVT